MPAVVQVPKATTAAAVHEQGQQGQEQQEQQVKQEDAMEDGEVVADGKQLVESLGGYEVAGMKEPKVRLIAGQGIL